MSASHDTHGSGKHDYGFVHVVPVPVLAAVLGALLFLTVITVAVTWVDMGSLNVWVALLIATVKASLVLLYFMHLRYDRPINAVIFVASLLFVALFLGIVLMDSNAYQADLIPGYAPALHK